MTSSSEVMVYIRIPREDFPRIRELSNRALDFPLVVQNFQQAVRALMADTDLGPEEFTAQFQGLWTAFEANLGTMDHVMLALVPVLSTVTTTAEIARCMHNTETTVRRWLRLAQTT